jgi:hypothetical protein
LRPLSFLGTSEVSFSFGSNLVAGHGSRCGDIVRLRR